MKTLPSPQAKLTALSAAAHSGYLMIECLVYIGVVFILLGAGFVMLYRCIENSTALRRNADAITAALHAGERWRADIRAAHGVIRVEQAPGGSILHIPQQTNEVAYRFVTNAIMRRFGQGNWSCVLPNVKNFRMESDPRKSVLAWTWELELETGRKASVSRLRPLFTFTVVSSTNDLKTMILRSPITTTRKYRGNGGMAVIAVIALLAILLIYVAGNLRTLHQLGRELAHVEQKQVARLKKESNTALFPNDAISTNLTLLDRAGNGPIVR